MFSKQYLLVLCLLIFTSTIVAQDIDTKSIYKYQKDAFRLIFKQPKRAINITDSLISIHNHWPDSLKANNFKNKAILNAIQNDLDTALYYFNLSLDHLDPKQPEYPKMLNNIAVVYKKQNRFQKAFEVIELGDSIARAESNYNALALLAGQRATCYTRLQNFNLAIDFQKQAIDYFEKNKASREELIIEKHNLANLYMESGNYTIAKKCFKALIPKLKDIDRQQTYYLAQLNLSKCEIKLGNYRIADSLVTLSKSGLKEFNNANFLSYADELKAEILVEQKQFDEAKQLYQFIVDKAFLNNNERLYDIASKYVKVLIETNNLQQSRAFIKKILNFSQTNPTRSYGLIDQIEFFKQVSSLISPENINDPSFYALKRLSVLQDSLHQLSNFALKRQLALEYEKQIAEKDNIILAKKISSEKDKNFILIFFALSVTLILLFMINYFRNNQKIARLEDLKRQREEKLLKSKLKAEQNLNEFKEHEIEKQKAEVMALTVERTKTINKFIELSKEFDKQTQKKISEKISQVTKTDKYWDHIQQKFKRLNPHFVSQLKQLYPSISNSQVDFCTLVKMRLDNKRIADILNITHESVITKKYRIKKKMGLDKTTDFTSYIESL